MPVYDISFRCKDCGHAHATRLRLHIEEGPPGKESIAEFFHGRSVPPQVEAARGHKAVCPKTGKKFLVENESDIFLMPPENYRRVPAIH